MNDYSEWRSAVTDMTEMDRAVTEHEVRQGLCGEREDARGDY